MSPVFASLLAVAAALFAYAVYRTKKIYRTWKDRGVKQEEPVLFVGNFLRTILQKASQGDRLKEVCDKFPDEKLVGFYEFISPVLVIKDAEYVESVLIKDFPHFVDHGFEVNETANPLDVSLFTMTGKRWRAYRNKLSPIFTTGKLKTMYGLMSDIGDNMLKAIGEESNVCVDMKEVLGRFSMDVIGSFAFGMEAATLADPKSEFRKMGKKTFEFGIKQFLRFAFITNFPNLSKRIGLSFNTKEVQDYFGNIIKDVINYRVENKTRRNDLLDLMLQLREKGSVEITTKDPSDDYLGITNDTYTTEKFDTMNNYAYSHIPTKNDPLTDMAEFIPLKNNIGLVGHRFFLAIGILAINSPTSMLNDEIEQWHLCTSDGIHSEWLNSEKHPLMSSFREVATRQSIEEVTDDLIVGQAFVFLTAGFEASASTMSLALYELAKNPEIQERARSEINEKVQAHGHLSFDSIKEMTYLDMCLKETLRKYPPAQVIFRMCTKEYTFSNGVTVKPGEKLIIPILSIHLSAEYFPDPMTFDPERFGPDVFRKPCTFLPFGDGPRVCIAMRFAMQEMKYCLAKVLMSYRIIVNPKTIEPIELKKTSFITTPKHSIFFDLESIPS